MLLHNSWPMSLVARKPAEGTDVSAWMLWIWIYAQGTKHRPNEMGIMPHCEKFSHWPVCTIALHNPCKFSFCYSWLKTVVVWVGQSNLAFCCRVEIISIPGSAMSKMFFQWRGQGPLTIFVFANILTMHSIASMNLLVSWIKVKMVFEDYAVLVWVQMANVQSQ